jgi:hypothetical protein
MDAVVSWLRDWWWLVAFMVAVAMKVLNKIPVHFSEYKGLKRWCLFLVDLLDVVKSTPAPPRGGGK